jgi:predicted nucleotidyltransferase
VKIQSAATTALTKSEIKQRRISRLARREKLSNFQKKQLLEKEEKEKALQQLEAEKQVRIDESILRVCLCSNARASDYSRYSIGH